MLNGANKLRLRIGSLKPKFIRSKFNNRYISSIKSVRKANLQTQGFFSRNPVEKSFKDTLRKFCKWKNPCLVVVEGDSHGIYTSRRSLERQVKYLKDVQYKEFSRLEAAQSYYLARVKLHPEDGMFLAMTVSDEVEGKQKITEEKRSKDSVVTNKDKTSHIDADLANNRSSPLHDKNISGFETFSAIEKAPRFIKESPNHTSLGIVDSSTSTQNIPTSIGIKSHTPVPVSNIYTDGSYQCSPHGESCGIGVFYGPYDPKNISEPLIVKNPSSYFAEIYAIYKALCGICREIKEYQNDKKFIFPKYIINTDHKNAAHILSKTEWKPNHPSFKNIQCGALLSNLCKKVVKIREFYRKNADIFGGHSFTVNWVKAHSGIIGNEVADTLAYLGRNHIKFTEQDL